MSKAEKIETTMTLVREYLQQADLITTNSASFWPKFVSMINIDHE